MIQRIIGVDQANRNWLVGSRRSSIKKITRRISPKGVAYSFIGLVSLIAAIAILFIASSVASANAPVCYDVDHEQAELIASDEMDEHIAKNGNGDKFRLWDLQ